MRRSIAGAVTAAILWAHTAQAIVLTGDVETDFSATQNCLEDTGGTDGLDVGMPVPVQANISGLDIDQVCFFYESATDTLFVGIQTFANVIFGDVDGNGDPAGVAGGYGGLDSADLGGTESIVIAIDTDADSAANGFDASTIEVVIGVSSSGSLATVGAFEPAGAFNAFNPAAGFGATQLATVTAFASPSVAAKDLELSIEDFSTIGTMADEPILMIFAGSTAASGIGTDFLPSPGESVAVSIFDGDRDDLDDDDELTEGTDPTDSDTDDDALTDGTEVGGSNPTDPLNPDSDGDACLDGEEDSNLNGSFDAGETNPNVVDTDGDLLDDCVEVNGTNPTDPNDTDTDNDTCSDGAEDLNHNGGLDDGESNPNIADTDGGGVTDCVEINTGFDPNDPTDDDEAAQVAAAAPAGTDQVQGSGLTCSLKLHANAPANGFGMSLTVLGWAALLLFRRWMRRVL